MSKNRIYALVLIVVLSAAAAFGQTGLVKRVVSKSDKLDFGAGGTVAIVGAPKGSIRVEAAEQNEIEVNAEITLQAASEADLDTLQKVTSYVLDESLGRVAITSLGTHDAKYIKQVAKKFPKNLIGLPFSIDYVIKVPRYCDLRIDGGSGDVTVKGVEGSLAINSLEGNARLDLVGGGVSATFGKGNVFVTMPDRSWRGNAIDIALAAGEMDVYMPVNLSAELDATILKTGKIENGLLDLKPRVRTVKFTEQSISAKAGSGGVPMKFTVGDGTLRLKTIGKN
jgi:DUF4097 and DUF4098 domain-containing protein YvlB